MTQTAKPKKTCPLTLATFAASALPLAVTVARPEVEGDAVIYVEPKAFSTGNLGLWGQGKVHATIGGEAVALQVGVNMVLVGSGQADDATKAATLAALRGVVVKLHFGTRSHDGARLDPAVGGERVFPAQLKAPFATGSFGWNVNTKLPTDEGVLQVGINVTVVGSKDAPRS